MSTQVKSILGGAKLVFDAVEGVTNAVEQMHANIASTPTRLITGAPPSTASPGLIAAGVYKGIRGVNAALRGTATGGARLIPAEGQAAEDHSTIKATAALNGVIGDHLEATGNPLATDMQLLADGQALDLDATGLTDAFPQASPHIVVFVHGLTLSELSWQMKGQPGLGHKLSAELGHSALYLRYNTGRHISTNGREFAELLAELCAAWPTPVESLSLIGHSMGGLVIRSACWYAQQAQARWLEPLRRIVCLGTPHHGAPLEKAGHLLDRMMLATPYTAPLAFGRNRSAGIKDLRHGNLLDEDWQGWDPDVHGADTRRPVPLLENVDYYFAAATLGRDLQDPIGHALGDLLVRLGSALGSHPDQLRRVGIDPDKCRVFHERHHFDLLYDERVHRQVVAWFNESGDSLPVPPRAGGDVVSGKNSAA